MNRYAVVAKSPSTTPRFSGRRRSLKRTAVAAAVGIVAVAGLTSCAAKSSANKDGGATAASSRSACIDGKVKFGVAYIADGAVAAAQASGKTISKTGAAAAAAAIQAQFTTGIKYLNAHGGWAGCTVEPVYFQFHIVNSDFNAQDQQMCIKFYSAKVFAAINWFTNDTPLLPKCLSEHGIPTIWDSDQFQLDDDLYTKYAGYLYQPWGFSYDRWGGFLDALKQEGVLKSGLHVGIVTADNGAGAEQHLTDDIWVPKLKQMGMQVETFGYKNILGFQGLSDVATSMSAAVLKFKKAGVTHVLFTPSASVSTLEFSVAAGSQGYHPAYIGNSLEAPTSYLGPADKAKAASVSFLPGRDTAPPLPAVVGRSNPANSARDLCANTVYKGQATPPYDFCDAMFFIQQAVKAGKTLTPAALKSGVENLGTSFVSAVGYGPTKFGPGVYDGGQQVRVLTWDTKLSAFNYGAPPVDVP